MKQLTCEMCGSTELLKTEGVFVCQTCGTKYSVEEAKKMMVEGTVEVTGTVKVDKTNEIENRVQNIINEFNKGNNDNVERMCIELLNIDPKNYQAMIYSGLAAGWKSTIAQPQMLKASNELKRGVSVIRNLYEDDKNYLKECLIPVREMARLAKAMFDLYDKHQKEQAKQCDLYSIQMDRYRSLGMMDLAVKYLIMRDNLRKKTIEECGNGAQSTCVAVCELFMEILNNVKNQDSVSEDFLKELSTSVLVCSNYIIRNSSCGKLYDSIWDCIGNMRKLSKEKRIEKYWAKHLHEKELLVAEENNLNEVRQKYINDIKELKIQKDNVPSLKLLTEKQNEIENLEKQLKSLGLFKGKEKKELRGKIEILTTEKNKITTQVTAEQTEIQNKIDPMDNELKKATARVDEIYRELTMDRNED